MMLDVGQALARVEEHVGLPAMDALAGDWARLFARCADATPFAHPAWTLAWARHLATATPLVVCVRSDAELRALVPLQLCSDGAVELAGAPVSDYRDALIAPDAGDDVCAQLVAAIGRVARAGCELGDVPAASRLLRAPAPPGWRDAIDACAVCPVVTVPSGARLADIMSARLHEDLERCRRQLARRGALAIRPARLHDCDAWVDHLIALHASRWRASDSDGDGVLADARVQRFHHEVARAFAAAGLLALTALTLDGEPVAVVYGFRRSHRFHYYLTGFDPRFARSSIGSLAIAAAFEHAIAGGARELDLLRGAEPYKYRWGARDRATLRRRLWREAACAR